MKVETDAWKLRTQVEQLTNGKLSTEASFNSRLNQAVCSESASPRTSTAGKPLARRQRIIGV